MKRGCSSSSDRLTGGTDDVNPQMMQVYQTNAWTPPTGGGGLAWNFPLTNPAWDINRAQAASCQKNPKALVMEVLRIEMTTFGGDAIGVGSTVPAQISTMAGMVATNELKPLASTTGYQALVEYVTQITKNLPITSGNMLAFTQRDNYVGAAGGTTGTAQQNNPTTQTFDLTDGDGHGVIIGTQYLWLTIGLFTTNTVVAAGTTNVNVVANVLYRYKQVPYDEYIRQFTFGI